MVEMGQDASEPMLAAAADKVSQDEVVAVATCARVARPHSESGTR